IGGEKCSKARFMMAVHSSASICSARVVEPTTSTKSTVTILRSLVTSAMRILLTSAVGVSVFRCCRRSLSEEVVVPVGWPQDVQKRSPADIGAPQLAQAILSALPQLRQKRAESGFWVWHFGQIIAYGSHSSRCSAVRISDSCAARKQEKSESPP